MNKNKIFFSTILSLNLLLLTPIVSLAADLPTNATTIVTSELSQAEIDEQVEKAFDEILMKRNMQRIPQYEYKIEQQGYQTATKVGIGYAGNQLLTGTVFATEGGFYWTDGGYETNVSFNVGYGGFSLGVSRGKTGGESGKYIKSPYVNQACKLYIHKDIRVSHAKAYRRNYNTTGPWIFDSDLYASVPVRDYLTVYKY